MRLPTVDAWQRQLSNTISLDLAYVGNKGTHVFAGTGGDYDPNQVSLDGFGVTSTNQRKPFLQRFGWSQNLLYFGGDASKNYKALQVKIEKRFASGLQLLSHYTWSRNMDFAGIYYPINAKYFYGPFGQQSRACLDARFFAGTAGWMAGEQGVERRAIRPAIPTVTAAGAVLTWWAIEGLRTRVSLDGSTRLRACSRPTARCQDRGNVRRRACRANVGRNGLWGPHFAQLDLSFFKTFAVREKVKAHFRAESFNFTNHANLGQPNGSVDNPGVNGRIFNAIGNYVPRQVADGFEGAVLKFGNPLGRGLRGQGDSLAELSSNDGSTGVFQARRDRGGDPRG